MAGYQTWWHSTANLLAIPRVFHVTIAIFPSGPHGIALPSDNQSSLDIQVFTGGCWDGGGNGVGKDSCSSITHLCSPWPGRGCSRARAQLQRWASARLLLTLLGHGLGSGVLPAEPQDNVSWGRQREWQEHIVRISPEDKPQVGVSGAERFGSELSPPECSGPAARGPHGWASPGRAAAGVLSSPGFMKKCSG